MDAIITYVNGLDPVWQEQYARFVGGKALTKRYRDWGTLKYLLRGIEKHIPAIRNVFLVVSSKSQVPDWVDSSVLHIVEHKDIIPEQFLPTFNSTTIEMFLHRIPDLGEEFLYFNDDMFPVMDCTESDFFIDGKSAIGFKHHLFANCGYKRRVRNSDRQARRVLGVKSSPLFIRPQHTCSPMVRSESEKIFAASEEIINKVASRLRTDDNFNQYLFLDYLYFQGRTIGGCISNKHLSPAVFKPGQIRSYIDNPSRKMICINDVQMGEEEFERYRTEITDAFENHFPEKSRFEL